MDYNKIVKKGRLIMLSPYLVLKSAVGAVQDRHFIGKNSNKKLTSIDATYYNRMVAETGQNTHNPITYFKNLKKAYNVNVDRFELVAQANAPFKKPSTISKVVKTIRNSLKG